MKKRKRKKNLRDRSFSSLGITDTNGKICWVSLTNEFLWSATKVRIIPQYRTAAVQKVKEKKQTNNT
jgi:hypothetical protein